MAGEQDILSLGLNVDSFNQQKMNVLKQYIALFNDLAKFDGKIFNPVMGDGLTTFNTSITQTSKILDEMNAKMIKLTALMSEQNKVNTANQIGLSETGKAMAGVATQEERLIRSKQSEKKQNNDLLSDYLKLKQLLKEQADAYSQLYINKGKYDAQTKAALRDYGATAAIINRVDKNLSAAGGAAAGFSRNLGTMFGHLRNIAYILPGLGIAGIFNIIFEGIERGVEGLGIFNSGLTSTAKLQTEMNNAVAEQLNLYQKLNKERRDFIENYGKDLIDNRFETQTVKQFADQVAIQEARGVAKDKLFPLEVANAEYRLDKATKDLGGKSIDELTNQAKQHLSDIRASLSEVENINNIRIKTIEIMKTLGGGKAEWASTKFDALVEREKSRQAVSQAEYDTIKSKIKEFFDAKQDYGVKDAAFTKFKEDEERKLAFETAKNNISVNLEKNKQILQNDKKFHDDKQAAINRVYDNEVASAIAAKENIVKNLSSTAADLSIAESTYDAEVQKALIKKNEAIEKNDVEFYQRRITALTEIQKDEIEMEAIKDERIFLNETKSMEDRLEAYENYIIKKQRIKDLEHDLAIQRGARGPGAATSLTPEEQERIGTHRYTQQFNIQSDAEKRTYQIVETSLNRELDLVKKINEQEVQINKDAYAKELEATNERFKNKIFQYEAFKKNKEFIDKKYGVILSLDEEIKRDIENSNRLQDLYDKLIQRKNASDVDLTELQGQSSTAQEGTRDALDTERWFNEELGRNTALNDAILKTKVELDAALEKGEDDKVKAAKARYEQLIQFQKEHADNMRQIQEEMWRLADTMVRGNFENELESIRLKAETRIESIQNEQDAIEDSTIDQKNKTALTIQLRQQEIEEEKKAAAEERKLKHEQAVKDRDLAIARVTWNGIESVTAALKLPPPAGELLAIERGIIAALQLANLLAVPLPAYKFGTPPEGHPGGLALFGEDGPEKVSIPGRSSFIANKATVANLPKGTDIVPIRTDFPEFGKQSPDESWEQARYIAKTISKVNKREIKNIFKPTILVDLSFENRKREILGR